ncbi:MAG: ATP-binding protein [Acidimicrobiales bacterium]
MARSDLLVSLVRSGSAGDQVGFRRAVEAIIAEEQAKQHGVLASQLSDALKEERPRRIGPPAEAGSSSLVFEFEPRRRLDHLVLPEQIRDAVTEIIEEHHRVDLLRSYGLEPRHRIMLVGPPGSGKTSLAEAIATETMVPLLVARYEALITSYLGETSGRLDALFEAVRARPCVLFFDEFDTIAKERGDIHETGEIKRVVSSLLLQIDRLPHYVIVVVATNHPELLDRAVWRRFQARLGLPAASRAGIIRFLDRWVEQSGVGLGYAHRTLADKLLGASYAEVEEFVQTVQRRLVLAGPDARERDVAKSCLDQWLNQVEHLT